MKTELDEAEDIFLREKVKMTGTKFQLFIVFWLVETRSFFHRSQMEDRRDFDEYFQTISRLRKIFVIKKNAFLFRFRRKKIGENMKENEFDWFESSSMVWKENLMSNRKMSNSTKNIDAKRRENIKENLRFLENLKIGEVRFAFYIL